MNQDNLQPDRSPGGTQKKTSGEILTQSALDYIESHYKERFSLQTIAGELYVNGSYLLRVFKKHTGRTLLAYHNHVRCERAKELLRNTDKSVSEAGEETGFVSSAHFTHVFKKTQGCTPTEYRYRHRLTGKEEETP